MNGAIECSVQGCRRPGIAAVEKQPVCFTHFMTVSFEKLELLSENIQELWLDGPRQQSALQFMQECPKQAIDISQNNPELTIQERAGLVEVVLWATQIQRQMLRPPDIAISDPSSQGV
jgi:hypothetical protein